VDLVVAECVYVLGSFYEVHRARVAEVMRAVIAFPSIRTIDPQSLLRALEIYEVDRLDFRGGVTRRARRSHRSKTARTVTQRPARSVSAGKRPRGGEPGMPGPGVGDIRCPHGC